MEVVFNKVKWKRQSFLVNKVVSLFGLIAKVIKNEWGRETHQNPFRSLETETRERF